MMDPELITNLVSPATGVVTVVAAGREVAATPSEKHAAVTPAENTRICVGKVGKVSVRDCVRKIGTLLGFVIVMVSVAVPGDADTNPGEITLVTVGASGLSTQLPESPTPPPAATRVFPTLGKVWLSKT